MEITVKQPVRAIYPPKSDTVFNWTLMLECGHESDWPKGQIPPMAANCRSCASKAQHFLIKEIANRLYPPEAAE